MDYIKSALSHIFDQKALKRARQAFRKSYVNDEGGYYYLFTRYHMGSSAAFLLSLYNLFQIRQKVIKHAIHFTGSNNPRIVKPAMIAVGFVYWLGLLIVWHIPSIGMESAARTYVAAQDATTAYLLSGEQIAARVLNESKRKKVLAKQGISLKDNNKVTKQS